MELRVKMNLFSVNLPRTFTLKLKGNSHPNNSSSSVSRLEVWEEKKGVKINTDDKPSFSQREWIAQHSAKTGPEALLCVGGPLIS